MNFPPPTLEDYDRARPRGVRPPAPMPTTVEMNGELLAKILGFDTPTVQVSESTVRGLPAAGAGVQMVAHAVATMMTKGKVRTAAGALDTYRPPIIERPYPLMGSFEFWYQLVECLMMRGNYIAVPTDFDLDGWARQVVPIHPDAVTMEMTFGLPRYRIGAAVFAWDEILHIRHKAPVGTLWGQGIVEQYRKALRGQLYEQNYGESAYSSGGVPSAVISLDTGGKPVPQEVTDQVAADWATIHGGVRRPAVVPNAMGITPLSWSPKDAMFIEATQMSVAEAALMCGLDPADLGASIGGSSMTYANLTDRQLSRILQSFAPWRTLVEEAWSDLLPGGNQFEGDPMALLRTSTKETYETHKLAQEIGVETPAETRELLGRPPAPASTTTEVTAP